MGNVKDFVIEDGVLEKYRGKDANVIIPDGINCIGECAFQRRNIESVVIPDSVSVIGDFAFFYCKKLRTVKFPRNLRIIGKMAFKGCCELERVEFYDKLERIGEAAFLCCSNISELVCSNVSPSVHFGSFSICDKLYDENGLLIINGVLLNTHEPKRRIKIPDSVKRIQSMFSWNAIASVTIPDTVEEIDDGALGGLCLASNFSFRYKPADAKEARRLVMKVFDWERLAYRYLDNGLKGDKLFIEAVKNQIGSVPGRRKIWTWSVYDDSFKMSRFLECCKKVPLDELDRAIKKTKNLTVRAVLIDYKNSNYTVQEIEAYESDLMDKELGIKEKTLADWRKEFKIVKKNDRYVITGYKEEVVEEEFRANKDYYNVVVIPAKICGLGVDVGDRVFQHCEYVNEVIVEEGVEKIGILAFRDCRRLKAVHFPSSVKKIVLLRWSIYALCDGRNEFTVYAPYASAAYWEATRQKIKVVVEN